MIAPGNIEPAGPRGLKPQEYLTALEAAIDEFGKTLGAAVRTFVVGMRDLILSIPGKFLHFPPPSPMKVVAEVYFEGIQLIENLAQTLQDAPWAALFTFLASLPPLKVDHARSRVMSGERFCNGVILAVVLAGRDIVTTSPTTTFQGRWIMRLKKVKPIAKLLEDWIEGRLAAAKFAKLILHTLVGVFKACFTWGVIVLLGVFVQTISNPVTFDRFFGKLFYGQNKPRPYLSGPYRTRKP